MIIAILTAAYFLAMLAAVVTGHVGWFWALPIWGRFLVFLPLIAGTVTTGLRYGSGGK